MNIVVFIDSKGGRSFQGRRLSRDDVATKWVLKQAKGHPIYCSAYTAHLFDFLSPEERRAADIRIGEPDEKQEDAFFVSETECLTFLYPKIDKIYVVNWNRCYPMDYWLEFPISQMPHLHREEAVGQSHEKLIFEIYQAVHVKPRARSVVQMR